MALDRGGKRAAIPRGTAFLVIGSKAAGVLTSGPGTAITAACVDRKPAKVPAYPLSGNAQSGLGTPIIAIRVPRGRSLDTKQATLGPSSTRSRRTRRSCSSSSISARRSASPG